MLLQIQMATVWQLIAQGDTGSVMNTRGDIINTNAHKQTRLAIVYSGSVLTTDGHRP